jgi:hypothetical protein
MGLPSSLDNTCWGSAGITEHMIYAFFEGTERRFGYGQACTVSCPSGSYSLKRHQNTPSCEMPGDKAGGTWCTLPTSGHVSRFSRPFPLQLFQFPSLLIPVSVVSLSSRPFGQSNRPHPTPRTIASLSSPGLRILHSELVFSYFSDNTVLSVALNFLSFTHNSTVSSGLTYLGSLFFFQ